MNKYVLPDFVVKSVVETAIKNEDWELLTKLIKEGHEDIVKMATKAALAKEA
tara:strand:- start:206 stop:361 length:156 start_codon:yes stop_codon:yes gene_type:complete